MREPAEITLRSTPGKRVVEEWALVLASAGVPHRIERVGDAWTLLVAGADQPYAAAALDADDREAAARPRPAPPPAEHGRSWAGVVLAALLLAFYRLTGQNVGGGRWVERGIADGARILGGEAWRTVTALTLHAGPVHVLGNAVTCALFVTPVCRLLGPGLGCWLVLLAGAGGNALSALVHGPPHRALGASTAIFGAVGILGGLAAVRRRTGATPGRRGWVPVAASLALLALLGTGERADLAAHLFGFLVGLAEGLSAPRPPGAALQRVLVATAAATVAGCWLLALA
jgi:membrane associated rhomboid family serine protease